MHNRNFIYSALTFTAFIIFLSWLGPITAKFDQYTWGFWIGVIPLLGMLLILLVPVGNALVPDKDVRGAVLGRMAPFYLVYLVLNTVGHHYIASNGIFAWVITGVLYAAGIVGIWRSEQRPHHEDH